MKRIDYRTDDADAWLPRVLDSLKYLGYAVVGGVLDETEVTRTLAASARCRLAVGKELGDERLEAARDRGHSEWRLPLAYEDEFLEFLARPELVRIVDAVLSPTSVLRFQNLECTPPATEDKREWNQFRYHMNTQRVMNGYVASLDLFYPLTTLNFCLAPGTHQQMDPPAEDYLLWAEEALQFQPGDLFVMDSTLWHREALNTSEANQEAITIQFTRSFMKPHFDYPRVLGEARIRALPERVQAMLGWHTRVPASLEEFYVDDPDKRLYRPGQG